MKNSELKFKCLDIFYILMSLTPLIFAVFIKILTDVPSDELSISGGQIYFEILLPFGRFPIGEVQLNLFCVSVSVIFLGVFATHGLKTHPQLKRQYIAEWIVETSERAVSENMGKHFQKMPSFIIALFALSLFSSLTSLLGLFPPTADINTVGAWAIMVFAMITFYKFKGGLREYLRSFTRPVTFLTPINIISEIATPVSMSFRHFGNILSGSVIMSLIYYGLSRLSKMLLSPISQWVADIPIFSVGIPALFSVYFDLFSSVLQAFIFVMLTMLNISGGVPEEIKKE